MVAKLSDIDQRLKKLDGKFVVRGEVRLDLSNKDVFQSGDTWVGHQFTSAINLDLFVLTCWFSGLFRHDLSPGCRKRREDQHKACRLRERASKMTSMEMPLRFVDERLHPTALGRVVSCAAQHQDRRARQEDDGLQEQASGELGGPTTGACWMR